MSFTPAVSRDGFSYSVDSLYAEASNKSWHRRATIAELDGLFHPSKTKSSAAIPEPVGHWYEAQLLHYGLATSKTKAVAKSRLLDAVNKRALIVPVRIQNLEEELKREWLKKDRAAKRTPHGRALGSSSTTAKKIEDTIVNTRPPRKLKRAREEEIELPQSNLSLQVIVNTATGVQTRIPAASKKETAKRATPSANSERHKSDLSRESKLHAQSSASTRGGGSARGRGRTNPGRTTKHTSTGNAVKKTPTIKESPSPIVPRKKQTARRPSGRILGRDAFSTSGPRTKIEEVDYGLGEYYVEHYDEKSVEATGDDYSVDCGDEYGDDRDDGYNDDYIDDYIDGYGRDYIDKCDDYFDEDFVKHEPLSPTQTSAFTDELQPLGLINGLYEIQSSDLDQWRDMFDEADFNLILCLHGNAIWGAYDFGMHSGIIHLPSRPFQSSYTPISFAWRGQENSEGQMSFGSNCHGWLRFLGAGRIEGMITCYGEAKFTGQRVSGNETRAPMSSTDMQDQWERYNEDAYERARVGRWGSRRW